MRNSNTRRLFLRSIAAASAVGAAGVGIGSGQSDDGTDADSEGAESLVATVAVAPEGDLAFEPDSVEIPLGGRVEWEFEDDGHNVSTYDVASDAVSIPAGAEPFASYAEDDEDEDLEPDDLDHDAVIEEGETFAHTFTVAGEYAYVCTRHEPEMAGTVTVHPCVDETVAVAPDGDLTFDPETLEVGLGDTVEWEFEDDGHNVSTYDVASDAVSIPDGAEPFASYNEYDVDPEDLDHDAVLEEGETFAQTFTVAGEYEYVCTRHEPEMAGTVEVSDEPDAEVIAGPDGAWRFEPETVRVTAGDVVRWEFDSAGHNATSHPGAADETSNPEGADWFATYEGDDHFSVVEEGTTFDHRFVVPGTYEYVCTPHLPTMAGEVVVEPCPTDDEDSDST
ncbi:plastocyanin [Halobiforma lacisalsi AJ5]|uniref:Blue (Type 1) copper domain-containing protein n=1 Tax=Natronobacterium lacisalsi AJ5 TaxID=358396 RepID=M0LS65_NATLA|nr:plastocyanin/azurin family copper-binding protein [Halobiforma lacisalsi]APW96875.1 plastocyanin [Halobiforma lacisalsi AJ5]EMA34905.1 blue (type 1) copper domain-containing protein [Halobiforma lacisalsi AJ5]